MGLFLARRQHKAELELEIHNGEAAEMGRSISVKHIVTDDITKRQKVDEHAQHHRPFRLYLPLYWKTVHLFVTLQIHIQLKTMYL